MKTILHVIDTTGPGGAETIFLQLANYVMRAGYRSIALIRGDGWVKSQLEELDVPFFVVDCKGSFNIKYLNHLIKIVREEKVDLIQSHLLGSSVYSCMAGLVTGKPVFVTMHGQVDISPSERFRWGKLLILRFGAKKIITVTDLLGDLISELSFIDKNKVITIYNGIDVDVYKKIDAAPYRRALGVPESEILIGSLGNIRKPKNYPLAIETIKQLHSKGLKVHFAIAGDGSENQISPLRALIESYRLNGYVHFLGFEKNTQMFLSALDVFLMSSSSEGHPLALTQAMANGLPIASTKSGVELIVSDEKDALLSRSMSSVDLAAVVETLIQDRKMAAKLGESAKKKANEEYSMSTMFGQYMDLYEKP